VIRENQASEFHNHNVPSNGQYFYFTYLITLLFVPDIEYLIWKIKVFPFLPSVIGKVVHV
jgi:hypothetical protein